jgi:hypothetical protein
MKVKDRPSGVMHISCFLTLGAFSFEKIIYQHFSSACDRRNTVQWIMARVCVDGDFNN